VIIRDGEDGIDVSAASGAGLRSTSTRTVRADLDEGDAAVAENELELMGSVLARS
jgi:hypothetical protein